jgi:archaellum component FlaC
MSRSRSILLLAVGIVVIIVVLILLGWALTLPSTLPRILLVFASIMVTIISLVLSSLLLYKRYEARTTQGNVEEYPNKVTIDINGSWITLESPDIERLGELAEKVTTNITSTNGHKLADAQQMFEAINGLQGVIKDVSSLVDTSNKNFARTIAGFENVSDQQSRSINNLLGNIGEIENIIKQLAVIYNQSKDVYDRLSKILPQMGREIAEMNTNQRASTDVLQTVAAHIDSVSKSISDVTRPLTAVNIPQMAQQIANQQQASFASLQQITYQQQAILVSLSRNLALLDQMEARLLLATPRKSWLGRLFSRNNVSNRP